MRLLQLLRQSWWTDEGSELSKALGQGIARGLQDGKTEWSPVNLECAKALYRADIGVELQTGARTWVNQVASPDAWLDLGPTTDTTAQPAIVSSHWASGKDAIRGDGINDYLQMSSFNTLMPPLSIYAVFQSSDLTATLTLFGKTSTDVVDISSTSGRVRYRANNILSTLTGSGAISADTKHRVIITVAANGDVTCYIDGVDVTTGTPNNTNDFDFQTICATGAASGFHTHHYGAFGFCQGDITGQVAQVDDWLAEWAGL
jgi:hypothetical protein